MAKVLINFRIEAEKLEKLKALAKIKNIKYTHIIREQINNILEIEKDTKTKKIVNKITKELRSPFIFLNTKPIEQIALEEKARRLRLAEKIERLII